jgi:PKD repeat protein
VLITQDWTSLTANPCNCGGIAYVGAYDDTTEYYKPAWVFFNRLGSGNEKYVAEAISHEAGHNLGLSHDGFNDGATSLGYYAGHGSGATGWAPIMGVGYYKELTQWSKGEYAYATQTQDDLAIMQARGAPLMADDHGDTAADATQMEISESSGTLSLSASGLIGSRADVDVFRFSMGAGNLSLNLVPGSRGPNLDISAGLYDANGHLVASSNPADALTASFNLNGMPAGTYYLVVDGAGKGDLSTGYSDYASLGEYFISGTAPGLGGVPSVPPVAMVSATPTTGTGPMLVNFSSAGSYDPDGGDLSYDWDFGDGSAHAATSASSHTYAPGSYTARLTVTDASGDSDQATVNITVTEPVMLPSLHVENIAMTASKTRKGVRATATVTVRNAVGKLVSGALVRGTWSGTVSGSVSGTTSSKGTVKFNSAYSKSGGTFTLTVTDIGLSGYVYDESQNKETSDSITR